MRVRTDFTMTPAAERDERKAKKLLHTDGTPLLDLCDAVPDRPAPPALPKHVLR